MPVETGGERGDLQSFDQILAEIESLIGGPEYVERLAARTAEEPGGKLAA